MKRQSFNDKVVLLSVLTLFAFPLTVAANEKAQPGVIEGHGDTKVVEIHRVSVEGKTELAGTINMADQVKGVIFRPGLKNLEPGLHGFHVHENPDCGPAEEEQEGGASSQAVAAGAAGGHLNPAVTGGHTGPFGEGHVGDLPNLYVDENGVANHPVYAPRISIRDLSGHALVIHAQADNYSDDPEENGGSGRRVACGVVQ